MIRQKFYNAILVNNKMNLISLLLLFSANLLNYMDRFIIFGVLVDIQKFYNLSDSQAGLLHTVFLVSYVTCSFIFGSIGDSVSRKFLLLVGLLTWSLSVFTSSFIPPKLYILFYVCRSLLGVGESSLSTLGFTIIGDLYVGDARTMALSLFNLACPIGSGLGYLIGPQIVKHSSSWQWTLRVTPGFSFLCAVLIMVIMKEPKRGEAEANELNVNFKTQKKDLIDISSPLSEQPSSPIEDVSYINKFYKNNVAYFILRKSFIFSTLAYAGISFVFGGLAVWVPKFFILVNNHYVKRPGHIDSSDMIGLIFGITTALTGLVGVVIGYQVTIMFRTKFKKIELYVCIVGSLIGSITLFVSIFTSIINMLVTWIIVSFTLLCLAILWTPNNEILLHVIGPRYRARGSAIQILTIHGLGDALSPAIIGLISDIRKKDNSDYWNLKSLQEALYITPFFLTIAAFFYFMCLGSFEEDCNETVLEATEIATSFNRTQECVS